MVHNIPYTHIGSRKLCVCMVYSHVWGHVNMVGIQLSLSPYSFETGSLTDPGTKLSVSKPQQASGLSLTELWLQVCRQPVTPALFITRFWWSKFKFSYLWYNCSYILSHVPNPLNYIYIDIHIVDIFSFLKNFNYMRMSVLSTGM